MKINHLLLIVLSFSTLPLHTVNAQSQGKIRLINRLLSNSQFNQAQKLLEDELQKGSCEKNALALMGRLYALQEQLQKAAHYYKKAITCGHHERKFLLEAATAFDLLQEYPQAISIYSTWLSKQADDVEFLHQRGLTYMMNLQYQQALDDLKQATSLSPENPQLIHDYAYALIKNKQPQQAYDLLTSLVERYSNFSDAYITLGDALVLLKNKEKAIQAYSQCLTQSPENLRALQRRARLYVNMGNYSAATPDYQKLIQQVPQNYLIAFNYIRVLFASHNNILAQQLYEQYKPHFTHDQMLQIDALILNVKKQ